MNIEEVKNTIICGDVRQVLKTLPDESVNCVVTSPPYYGLRDYGVDGQIGLEPSMEAFIETMVDVFREVRRVLRKDGTCWLNLGDSYAGSGKGGQSEEKRSENWQPTYANKGLTPNGLKPKDLCMVPARVAIALQADGWYLRQDIIWRKPNPMPESVTDRCTKSHEYIFLLTKSARYYFDAEAIKEESEATDESKKRAEYGRYKNNYGKTKDVLVKPDFLNVPGNDFGNGKRNKRDVWDVPTESFPESHFATFPQKLIEPCILAGCPEWVCPKCGKARERIAESEQLKRERPNEYIKRAGAEGTGNSINQTVAGVSVKTTGWTDCGCGEGFWPGIVLDPFGGAATTGLVAYKNRRDYILIELNPKYIEMAERRLNKEKNKLALFDEAI